MNKLPRAVLFDFDGTLADTEALHFAAFRDVLEPLRIHITWEEYAADYLGYDDPGVFEHVFRRAALPLTQQQLSRLVSEKNTIYEESIVRTPPLFAGIPAYVRKLTETRPAVIVSMASKPHIEMIIQAAELTSCFVGVVAAEDVRYPKPHPEGYLTGLKLLRQRVPDLTADECLVVEDSPQGSAAGKSAGMRVLGLLTSSDRSVLTAADYIVDKLIDLPPERLHEVFQ